MLAAAAFAAAAAAAAALKPHILVVVVDDLGWNGFGFNSDNGEVRTPNVDGLARDGVILDRYYAFRFCSPSRASLFTGRVPGHGIWELNPGQTAPIGINHNMTFIPGMLKKAGYVTHQIGKWHQGFYQPRYTPVGRGFDHSYTMLLGGCDHMTSCGSCANRFPATPDYADHARECPAAQSPCKLGCPSPGGADLWRDDKPAYGDNGTYTSYLWGAEAVRVIGQHDASVPLFVALMLHDVHQPVEAPEQFLRLYPESDYNASTVPRRYYNAMHSAADSVIGNVTAALKGRGMYENSVMVVYGDNGGTYEHGAPVYGSSNYPLRGFKYSFFEGGVRTTAFVHSPLLPAAVRGTRSQSIFHVSDWYATFCALAGVEADDGFAAAPVDGVNAWPRLSSAEKLPRPAAAWKGGTAEDEVLLGIKGGEYGHNAMGALLHGELKLIVGAQLKNADGWSAQYAGTTQHIPAPAERPCGSACLFNVTADVREMNDLAAEMPDTTAAMLARYRALVKEMDVPNGAEGVVLTTRGGLFEYEEAEDAAASPLCDVIRTTGFYGPWEADP
eukprot:TRINITY_DN2647_c0_g3_i1.p1 TRINITY_DN2647_c0_g3~~TRINITY_DN2647_c0_g3_i1.p1  ORF type:complete len:557 (+),score=189.37 TRINITY_DN2647_c0_g3_i1:53-1723(+)